jgi:hypothetical protein
MGNKPSAPSSPSPTSSSSSLELPPPCDLACEKQKKLALLKTALETASDTQDTDPAGYEKARIAYYTLLNGQGWLQTEKQRIGTQDVQPVLKDYTERYNALKGEKQSQSMFTKLSSALMAQENADTSDTSFLKKQLNAEKDKADVLDRLNTLSGGSQQIYSSSTWYSNYMSIVIDVIIAILAIGVLYLGYTKLTAIKSLIGIHTSVTDITT